MPTFGEAKCLKSMPTFGEAKCLKSMPTFGGAKCSKSLPTFGETKCLKSMPTIRRSQMLEKGKQRNMLMCQNISMKSGENKVDTPARTWLRSIHAF